MKKNIFQLFTILLLSVVFLGTSAQDRRTLDTKVADILAQMPTKELGQRDRVMAEIIKLGPEGFKKFSELLVPLGTGDDTAVRFALNSLVRYASAFGNEEERKYVESQLLSALEEHADTEVKTFLLNQLNLVAGDKAIDATKKYLTQKDLVEPVTQMMVQTGSKKATMALFEVLPQAGDDASKATLAKALGVLKCRQAVNIIASFSSSENPALKKAALAALANIGSPDSYDVLYKAAKSVNFTYEPTDAAEAFLNYTDRLGEENQTELCKKACKIIFKANQTDEKLHNYSKALAIYTKYFGSEALPLLLKAVDNSDKAFRYSALNLAEKMDDIATTRAWIEKAKSSADVTKAEIIDMLGRKGDLFAVNFITESLNSQSASVREESIKALVKLEDTKATYLIISHLVAGRDIEASKIALLQLLDKDHLAPVAEQMAKTSGKTKAAFIDLVAAKSGTAYFSEIYAFTKSNNADEKTAAFNALKRVSAEKDLDELLQLLLSVNNEKEIEEVQLAVVAAAKGVKSEQKESGKILTTLKNTNKKERLIAILPEIGGDAALETVIGYFNNSTGPTKETAFEALTNWQEYAASKALFEICQSNTAFREKAFASFIRQVSSTELPDDQKLLQYRKVMPFAKSTDEKIMVINSIGKLKTFLSLVYLEQFLNSNELQQTTARAIMKVALPGTDENDGFSGEIVRNLLDKVAAVISGEESDYDRINIKNYLEKMPKDKGFVSMFNGKNLEGWQGMLLNGNPIKIAGLTEKEKAKAQEEANKKMFENWSVRDNQIIFNGHGANLVSAKNYKDFEMIVDWKISKEGDSGIYLRGTPQVQIWDTSRVEVGAQVGSGGLYNNNKDNVRDPLKVADNPIDEWNTFRITMIGENVTVYLNGELVVDNIRMDNFWDRSIPIFPEGTIELQAHGNELAFRDIYVREINTAHIGLTDEEIADGFVSLFNGKNLDGWQGNLTDYFAENGEMVVNPKRGGHGNIFTDKEYSDFIFRFDFQLTPGANNGLGIRSPLEGDAAYAGMELQILDNTAPIYANLHEYQYHGSLYGVIPAKRGFLNPVGEWNSEEVIVKGSRVKVILNGETILDGDIKEASKNGTLDGNDHSGLNRDKGYIGFLGHGSELKFRNLRIKDLSK
ncbi:MAG: family 16 glycoside hydrolase [Draconibacterium sp.]